MSGIDPATKKYVGGEAVIKAQIAQVQADKKMSAKDKKEALDDLNQAAEGPGADRSRTRATSTLSSRITTSSPPSWATIRTDRQAAALCHAPRKRGIQYAAAFELEL